MNTTIKEINSPVFRSEIGKFFRENAVTAVVVSVELEGKSNSDRVLAIRSEWLKQFKAEWGAKVDSEPLGSDWGWNGFIVDLINKGLKLKPSNSADHGYRVRIIDAVDALSCLEEIKKAKEFLDQSITMNIFKIE